MKIIKQDARKRQITIRQKEPASTELAKWDIEHYKTNPLITSSSITGSNMTDVRIIGKTISLKIILPAKIEAVIELANKKLFDLICNGKYRLAYEMRSLGGGKLELLNIFIAGDPSNIPCGQCLNRGKGVCANCGGKYKKLK